MGLVESLEFSKVIMTVFIWAYSYYLLRKSERIEERRPWEYLYIAAMLLFLVQLIETLQLFKGGLYVTKLFRNIKAFMEFAFLGVFLLSFAFQHDLIVHRHLLMLKEASFHAWYDTLAERFTRYQKKHKEDHFQKLLGHFLPSSKQLPPPATTQDDELEGKARQIIAATRAVMRDYSERINKEKSTAMEAKVAELEELLGKRPLDAEKVKETIATIGGRYW